MRWHLNAIYLIFLFRFSRNGQREFLVFVLEKNNFYYKITDKSLFQKFIKEYASILSPLTMYFSSKVLELQGKYIENLKNIT